MLNAKDYDIDKELGFLPPICKKLPSCYDTWSILSNNLCNLTNEDLEIAIAGLPEFPSIQSKDIDTLRTVYSMLSFIIHGYIWKRGENNPRKVIPSQLAIPYCAVSQELGIAPILTHAAVDLYNWHLKDNNLPFTLDNLEINYKFTKYPDEAWFYKIHIIMEKIGGSVLAKIIELVNIPKEQLDDNNIIILLNDIKKYIKDISALIRKMNEGCDPKIFFYGFRPYLDGWKNKQKFPDGMLYEGVGYFAYGGGSAAQSSLIQALDTILGVEHVDDYSRTFLNDMLEYMPEKHRNFLHRLKSDNIKPYIATNQQDVVNAYNDCLTALEELRKVHMGLARNYVIKQIGGLETTEKASVPSAIALGTGGTEIKKFLNATIQQTKDSKI